MQCYSVAPPDAQHLKTEDECARLREEPDFLHPNSQLLQTHKGEQTVDTCEDQWVMLHEGALCHAIEFMAQHHHQALLIYQRKRRNAGMDFMDPANGVDECTQLIGHHSSYIPSTRSRDDIGAMPAGQSRDEAD